MVDAESYFPVYLDDDNSAGPRLRTKRRTFQLSRQVASEVLAPPLKLQRWGRDLDEVML
jgi:hypothetical protein